METKKQANQSEATFGERMSIEQFLESQGCKQFDVYPRTDKPGYYYFATEKSLGYVPQALGKKIDYINEHRAEIEAKKARGEELSDEEKLGRLFITEVTTPDQAEPMFMLCESKRESVFSFSLD